VFHPAATSIFGGSGTIVGSYIGLPDRRHACRSAWWRSGLGGDVADHGDRPWSSILAVTLHMLVERPERLKGLGFGNR